MGAILDFGITKYGNSQVNDFFVFFDPQNLGIDTKIISLAHLVEELGAILTCGSHLGRHLGFGTLKPKRKNATLIFLKAHDVLFQNQQSFCF